jgi:hypothetical protein
MFNIINLPIVQDIVINLDWLLLSDIIRFKWVSKRITLNISSLIVKDIVTKKNKLLQYQHEFVISSDLTKVLQNIIDNTSDWDNYYGQQSEYNYLVNITSLRYAYLVKNIMRVLNKINFLLSNLNCDTLIKNYLDITNTIEYLSLQPVKVETENLLLFVKNPYNYLIKKNLL